MSEVEAVSANNAVAEENSQNDKGTVKTKKGKAPRISTLDRAKEESEAIIKGINAEVEGRRLTRSAAKGVTATPPPPAKKERKSTSKGRGRPKKGSQNATDESDSHDENKDVVMTENEAKNNEETKKDQQPVENNSHEEKEQLANNNAEVAKEPEATENGAKEDSVDASTSGDDKKEEKSEETPSAETNTSTTEATDKPAE